eukprot:CAMPEP_0170499620 /NCGR_PEP_ID=MMETSP0208-20121228/32012_1 /TAXON_ID=197538 /ORGANISM="Strombidium inclinatum, Strain S3" /LENGTH=47 /DNA_ID= /DNA_START= /DNA_END= /DNA_ORIENTATION=
MINVDINSPFNNPKPVLYPHGGAQYAHNKQTGAHHMAQGQSHAHTQH